MMAVSVRLDDAFVTMAKIHADVEKRSTPKQIEHWATIGKILMENPELSYDFVRESLLAREEVKLGLKVKYVRRTTN